MDKDKFKVFCDGEEIDYAATPSLELTEECEPPLIPISGKEIFTVVAELSQYGMEVLESNRKIMEFIGEITKSIKEIKTYYNADNKEMAEFIKFIDDIAKVNKRNVKEYLNITMFQFYRNYKRNGGKII